MNLIKYSSQPKQGLSLKAWKYFVLKYGTPKTMAFYSPCGAHPYWMACINGKMEIVTPEEIRGFIKNGEKFILNPQK